MAIAVKALFFDVFGTLVDWRSGLAREAELSLKPLGHTLDWVAFADAWHAEYLAAVDEISFGGAPFRKLDLVHRQNLDKVISRMRVPALEKVRRHLTLAWHRLDAWPDVAPGLARLKRGLWTAPLSNGNISMMVGLARRNNFAWDAILGAELAGEYKPKPGVYLHACQAFDLPPEDCMMVAAHSRDLAYAAGLGLRTAHVARPDESGPGNGEAEPNVPVDMAVQDLQDLAHRLGL